MTALEDTEITYKIYLDICECLHSKSKWSFGAWSWVSLSNLSIYYDSKVVHNPDGFIPKKLNLSGTLEALGRIGLVEKNSDLFLQDAFFRLTQAGRNLVQAGMPGWAKLMSL